MTRAAALALCAAAAAAACGDSKPAVPTIARAKDLRSFAFEGIPIAGDIHYQVKLTVPGHDLARASGVVTFRCGQCTAGDGVTKIPGPARAGAFAGEGFTLPVVRLGDIDGSIAFQRGTGTLTAAAKGEPEVRLTVTGTVTLATELDQTGLDVTARAALDDQLAPTAALFGGGGPGGLQVHITGTLGTPRIRRR